MPVLKHHSPVLPALYQIISLRTKIKRERPEQLGVYTIHISFSLQCTKPEMHFNFLIRQHSIITSVLVQHVIYLFLNHGFWHALKVCHLGSICKMQVMVIPHPCNVYPPDGVVALLGLLHQFHLYVSKRTLARWWPVLFALGLKVRKHFLMFKHIPSACV